MRGRPSGNSDRLPCAQTPQGSSLDAGNVVQGDGFPPVTPEELNAIEAYLMPQIMALLQSGQERVADSEVPQKRGNNSPSDRA